MSLDELICAAYSPDDARLFADHKLTGVEKETIADFATKILTVFPLGANYCAPQKWSEKTEPPVELE